MNDSSVKGEVNGPGSIGANESEGAVIQSLGGLTN